MKMEQTECSEMSAYKLQTPGNYPKESIQVSKYLIEAEYRDILTVHVTAICGIEGGEMFVIVVCVVTPCGLEGGC